MLQIAGVPIRMTNKGRDQSSADFTQEQCFDSTGHADLPVAPSDGSIEGVGRQMLSRLSRVIEGDIIPRLMLALDQPGSTQTDQAIADRLRESVEEFVHLLIVHDASIATRYVSTLRTDGIPLSALYLDLLAPAARRLGVMWEEDECSFTDVTIGVCRMNQVLLEFSRCFDATAGAVQAGRNALVLPIPGEQHTFGMIMVMEFMRRGGWNCYTGNPGNHREFHRLVKSQDFDVIGLSVSSDKHIETTRKLISEIRHSVRNSDSVILAGGRVFVDNPELVEEVGADATAVDGREAVDELRRLHQGAQHKPSN